MKLLSLYNLWLIILHMHRLFKKANECKADVHLKVTRKHRVLRAVNSKKLFQNPLEDTLQILSFQNLKDFLQ